MIVGPSGAGKDTLLALTHAQLSHRADIVFVRRVITRAPDANEEHEPIDKRSFEALRAAGDFALAWEAHGLCYGVPKSIEAEIVAGRQVVVNLSRAIVAEARARYPSLVIEITAAEAQLRERLLRRGRESAEDIAMRLKSSRLASASSADIVIVNDGLVEQALRRLVALIGGD